MAKNQSTRAKKHARADHHYPVTINLSHLVHNTSPAIEKWPEGRATIFRGPRAELIRAGVPEEALARSGDAHCGGIRLSIKDSSCDHGVGTVRGYARTCHTLEGRAVRYDYEGQQELGIYADLLQLPTVAIDLSDQALRNRMVSQKVVVRYGYVMTYRGSRAQLIASGVPEAAFPSDRNAAKFMVQTASVCNHLGREPAMLYGSLTFIDGTFELLIRWHGHLPSKRVIHPAISELARMVLKDTSYWAGRDGNLVDTCDLLAADDRSDYKPAADLPRLQIKPTFQQDLIKRARELFDLVHDYCEIEQAAEKREVQSNPEPAETPARQAAPYLRLVIDNSK